MNADIVVVGGGAAGMMAAISAAQTLEANGNIGASIVLIEHNDKLGKKLFITGKGRCNVTNACDTETLFSSITKNPRFMYSSVYSFDNNAVMSFFEEAGVKLKIERGERVFPNSNHSSDIIRALADKLKELGVKILLNTKLVEVLTKKDIDGFELRVKSGKENSGIICRRLILATGGISYESTGSTGDGLKCAKKLGHTIETLYPSLVPFVVREEYVHSLMGLSLKNVNVSIYDGKKKIYDEFGEMLFTHYGVSGPLILTASAVVGADRIAKNELNILIDLKPALDEDTLDKRILRDFEKNINKNFENAISHLLPTKLIPVVIKLSGIDPYKKVHDLTREERAAFVSILKRFPMTVTDVCGFNEAIVTRGGVLTKEINPSTMESQIVPGLYFAGEMIDVDAKTGGFNLQIAWSSGHLAGESAADGLSEVVSE